MAPGGLRCLSPRFPFPQSMWNTFSLLLGREATALSAPYWEPGYFNHASANKHVQSRVFLACTHLNFQHRTQREVSITERTECCFPPCSSKKILSLIFSHFFKHVKRGTRGVPAPTSGDPLPRDARRTVPVSLWRSRPAGTRYSHHFPTEGHKTLMKKIQWRLLHGVAGKTLYGSLPGQFISGLEPGG